MVRENYKCDQRNESVSHQRLFCLAPFPGSFLYLAKVEKGRERTLGTRLYFVASDVTKIVTLLVILKEFLVPVDYIY